MITKEQFLEMKPLSLEKRSSKRLAIHVPGFLSRGYYSPERGESRWAQNLVKVLTEHGYIVMMINEENGWQECIRVGGMIPANWQQCDYQTEFDYMMDTAWHDRSAEINTKIKAKMYMMGFWGYDHQLKGEDALVARNKNYYYSYPIHSLYTRDETNVEMTNKDKKLFMPLPLFRDLPTRSNFNKIEILWAIKEFWRDNRAEKTRNILKAMKRLSDLHPEIFFNFFASHEFDNKDTPPDLKELVGSIKNKEMYDEYIPYNLVQDSLSRSKILITNGEPSTGPITLECVARGGVPLIWGDDHHWDFEGLPKDATEEQIFELLEKLYTSELFYEKLWTQLQEPLWCHQEHVALSIFENEMARALDEIKKS